MVKVANYGDVREPVHTVAGVLFIGPGRIRNVELTATGKRMVDASKTLRVIAPATGRKAQRTPETEKQDTDDAVDNREEKEAARLVEGGGEAARPV